jgi:hypothetical protein
MTRSSHRIRRARRAAAVAAAALTATLCACGSGDSQPSGAPVTVTVTPTVTATAPAGTSPGSPPSATPSADLHSDVVGRAHDLGTIVDVTTSAGTPVVVLDRWTVRGTSDSTLARDGVPIRVHSDAPYENQNTRSTFRIPVAPDATFTYHHCVAVDQPMQSRPATLQELAQLERGEDIVLLRLDASGRLTGAENDPAC